MFASKIYWLPKMSGYIIKENAQATGDNKLILCQFQDRYVEVIHQNIYFGSSKEKKKQAGNLIAECV
jgi:hypothetical protein